MDSTVFARPYLGTRLKNFITSRGYDPVGTSEWFSITTQQAWGLFTLMTKWDRKTLALDDESKLQVDIAQYLP
jgi:hypothetical protein